MRELEALLGERDRTIALDLAGDEAHFPAEWYQDHFRRARSAGWHITVHAGESAGPESIWQFVRSLKAERLGRAFRAIEDPELLDYLTEYRIGIESCLTSNVQTSCVPDFPAHPLRSFLDRGILATTNTDDPWISAIDLHHEFEVAAPHAGLHPDQIRRAQENVLEVSYLAEAEKRSLRREMKPS